MKIMAENKISKRNINNRESEENNSENKEETNGINKWIKYYQY